MESEIASEITKMKALLGNTYPIKDSLKSLGAKWEPNDRVWMIPEDKYQVAVDLLNKNKGANNGFRPYHPTICKQCGARASRYNKIYRNGICAQCYRDEQEERDMGY